MGERVISWPCACLPMLLKAQGDASLLPLCKLEDSSVERLPQNGSMILYNRKKVKYRKDGYCWKKRKDGKTTREDHMKLKVQGVENPDIVLVHYLNVPAVDDSGKPCGPVLCSINTDRKEWAKWSKEELIGQLKPMCAGSSLHQKCSSVKQRIISSKQESGATRAGAGQQTEEADGTEVQNSDVSEGQTEPSPGGGRNRAGGGERRNGRITKPSLLPQSSMEVSSSTFHQPGGGSRHHAELSVVNRQ
ncbi:hypothetical protein fugu_004735 [Takifugu bimaculatus]|uniref:CG-1 domain-containing protein n=1 Tax=Takifugu bimaculatus TaxID=433685 RepID=A0A4Z2B7W6_9TELE|nr:hypothetical protein fugu_004735 [Takifugu bimaculatus]